MKILLLDKKFKYMVLINSINTNTKCNKDFSSFKSKIKKLNSTKKIFSKYELTMKQSMKIILDLTFFIFDL